MITATIVSVTELSSQPHSGGILRHECIYIFDILYSSYPRMYLSYPLNILITIRINGNAYFSDSDMLHDSRIISSHLHDTAL